MDKEINPPVEIENIIFGDGMGGEFMRISGKDGIVFNREKFPTWEPDCFAKAFIHIIQKNYKVKIEEVEGEEEDSE